MLKQPTAEISLQNIHNNNHMKVLESNLKLTEVEARLSKYPFLSKNSLPGAIDAQIFQILQSAKKFPDRKIYPHFYHWYILMRQFAPPTMEKWIAMGLYFDPDDSLQAEFAKLFVKKEILNHPVSLMHLQSSQELFPPPELKMNRQQSQLDIEYIIDITPKLPAESVMETLRKELEEYKADVFELRDTHEIRIVYKMEGRCEELKDKVAKCVEFENMSVKKEKRGKLMGSGPISALQIQSA